MAYGGWITLVFQDCNAHIIVPCSCVDYSIKFNSIQLFCHYANTGLYSITKHCQCFVFFSRAITKCVVVYILCCAKANRQKQCVQTVQFVFRTCARSKSSISLVCGFKQYRYIRCTVQVGE